MNPEPMISVSDEGMLLFNAPMVAEIAALKESSSREAKRKCMKLAGNPDLGDAFLRELPDAFDIPATVEEKYIRSLAIVREIGRAVGHELREREYCGDIEPYLTCFWQGLTSKTGSADVTGAKLEKLFYECGHASLDVVASAIFPDDNPKDGEACEMASRILRAFFEGMKSCLV